MFPCGRRVHLHKSANLKTIFENILTNHTNYVKNDPKMIETLIKKPSNEWCGKKSKTDYPLDRFCPPLRHPWSAFLDFLEDVRSKFAPKFQDSRATNGTNHNF